MRKKVNEATAFYAVRVNEPLLLTGSSWRRECLTGFILKNQEVQYFSATNVMKQETVEFFEPLHQWNNYLSKWHCEYFALARQIVLRIIHADKTSS